MLSVVHSVCLRSEAVCVGAKEKQSHSSALYMWHAAKPGSCDFSFSVIAVSVIQLCSHGLQLMKYLNIFNWIFFHDYLVSYIIELASA